MGTNLVQKPAEGPGKRTRKKALQSAAPVLLPAKKQDSLVAWFQLYMRIEVGPEGTNTFKAKKRDLQEFVDYVQTAAGTDKPDQWTRSLTEGFLRHLQRERQLAPTSINRVLATLKHVSKWIHRQRPFLAGKPCERVQEITIEDLSDIEIARMKSPGEQLIHINTRKDQNPVRDYAIFLVLLHTGLRVSELIALDFSQYQGKYLVNIKRKGKKVTRELLLAKPAREGLDRYLETIRGRGPGPLIQSLSRESLAPQNVDSALKKMGAQANSTLPEAERINLSAHVLRHTALRRAAEKEDIRYAMKLSGHIEQVYLALHRTVQMRTRKSPGRVLLKSNRW